MNSPDPFEDDRWLDGLQDAESTDPEASRVGAALRKRHRQHQADAVSSGTNKDQLQQRLIAEGLYHDPSPNTSANRLQHWLSALMGRPLWLAGAFSVMIMIGVVGRLAPIWNTANPVTPTPLDESVTTRSGGSTSLTTALFPDEEIVGTQYQVVENLEQAEAAWRAALIEAGIEHKLVRRTVAPESTELHLKLSPAAADLKSRFALKNPPDHGEWVVILLPKSP